MPCTTKRAPRVTSARTLTSRARSIITRRSLDLSARVGINPFNGGSVVSALGGLRLRSNVDRLILPFVEVVAGLYHCGVCGTNALAIQGGGGVDFGRRDNKFRIRAQVDLRRVFNNPVDFNAVRFSLGVVLPLNK
jgi:hypothetical protein